MNTKGRSREGSPQIQMTLTWRNCMLMIIKQRLLVSPQTVVKGASVQLGWKRADHIRKNPLPDKPAALGNPTWTAQTKLNDTQ